MSLHPTAPIVADRVRSVLEAMSERGHEALPELASIYSDDVVFSDPIQTVRGRDEVLEMNRRLLDRARELRFEVHTAAETADTILLTWTITFVPKRRLPVKPLVIDGASELKLENGLVAGHYDYWDLLGAVMDAFPGLGALYRRVVRLFG
jgi:limonene-1,2-epoxide hydrolase